jgi:ATP-dependent helicase HepA
MLGYLVKHSEFEVGKILKFDDLRNGTMTVAFLKRDGAQITFDKQSLGRNVLRTYLPPGSRCRAPRGECEIKRISRPFENLSPAYYEVEYDGTGERDVLDEFILVPMRIAPVTDPVMKLAGLDHEGYPVFREREELRMILHLMLREGNGLRSLLSSRIDLRAHQAYVAGVVLLDRQRRYMLADEVGLGKTIEAGIVLRDLLVQNPHAKVLILCPGALTQQWLCELYTKFGDSSFRMLDLMTYEHSDGDVDPNLLKRSIVSMGLGLRILKSLERTNWDMVIVDEAHHLLGSPALYDLACQVTSRAGSILLLSAMPAQHREDEFRRLLALLEPERYSRMTAAHFRDLYDTQRDVGRKMRIVSKRLSSFAAGEAPFADALERARDFQAMPGLKDDPGLARMIGEIEKAAADPAEPTLASRGQDLLHYVADTYRINRRILRNRRQRLIDEGQIPAIGRRARLHPYRPDQLEINAATSVRDLLASMLRSAGDSADVPVVLALARSGFESLAWPVGAHRFLAALRQAVDSALAPLDVLSREIAETGHLMGYDDWDRYLALLCRGCHRLVDRALLSRATSAITAWMADGQTFTRLAALLDLLHARCGEKSTRPKQLVFAGYPGLAANLVGHLRALFGNDAVTAFHHGMPREEKERNVARFEDSRHAWILVSDETGGEGRNFQFADSLLHFDTPWHAARVEQRIGRLDRLGRAAEVVSDVLFNEWAEEGGLIGCYDRGLKVYSQSISGLEFALRDVERDLARAALEGGAGALDELAPRLAERTVVERARDDSEAVYDAASFERAAADRYRKVSQSEGTEAALETAFVRYFQRIGPHGAARNLNAPDFPGQVWLLAPDSLNRIKPAIQKDPATDRLPEFIGTFRRSIAQQRPGLDFFNVGHVLFDAVVESLGVDPVGRSFAIECVLPDREPWLGFELAFVPAPRLDRLEGNPGLLNRARQIILPRSEFVYIRPDGTIEPREIADAIHAMRRALDPAQKDRTWWNLTKENAHLLPPVVPGRNWQKVVMGLVEPAARDAAVSLGARLIREIEAEEARVGESLRLLRADDHPNAEQERRDLASLLEAVQGWQPHLDSIGFLSVNGNLRHPVARQGRRQW